jgi:predicted nucleic acid-binding protein
LRYWDSTAFLGWLNKDPESFGTCDRIIADAKAGKCRIVTSTITFAEVFWLKGRVTKGDNIEAIRELFGHSWVVPAELDRSTAELARDLLLTFARGNGLHPPDAIHLATAVRVKSMHDELENFDTWDETLHFIGTVLHRVECLKHEKSGSDLRVGVPVIERRIPFSELPSIWSPPKTFSTD